MQRLIIDLNETPRVYTIDKFLSPQECLHIIKYAKQEHMDRAKVSGPEDGVVSDARTNNVLWVNHYTDDVFTAVARRVANLIGIPLSHAESFQVINYQAGAEYRAHFDAFDPTTETGKRNWTLGGQRLVTALAYLNTVPKGGATSFTKLNLSVPAEQGKLLVFHNTADGTIRKHPLTLHAGMPVEAGEKWAFNLWFRARSRQEPKMDPTKAELDEFTRFLKKKA